MKSREEMSLTSVVWVHQKTWLKSLSVLRVPYCVNLTTPSYPQPEGAGSSTIQEYVSLAPNINMFTNCVASIQQSGAGMAQLQR
jgi:hypothetical protein